jgi:hypothetical protein
MVSKKPPTTCRWCRAGTFLANDHGGTCGDITADNFRDAAISQADA